MQYKVLALDLDGTLTNTEKVITPRTKAAFQEAARRGGKLVDAADAREVAAIDGVRRRNAGVLAHEHRGDADALRAQGAALGGGVVAARADRRTRG